MYNSIFVSAIIKFWEFISFEYNRSFLKKTMDAFSRGFAYLSNGSRIKSIFKSRDLLIEKSLIYDLYTKFMKSINRILGSIRKYLKEKREHSLICSNLYNLFATKIEVLRTFFVFTLSFAVGLLLINIVRGYYSGRSYIIIAVLIIGSIIGLLSKENYKDVLKTSFIYKFIYSIFSLEEGIEHGN